MFKLSLTNPDHALRHILCLGAHSDDIEIGCGATLLRLIREHPQLAVTWVVFSATEQRAEEAAASAADFLTGVYAPRVILHQYRDAFFPYEGIAIKESFETLKSLPYPDLVLTHCRHDRHQDHQVICNFTWNTFRDHLIWEYEIPKYDGDLATPNLYCHVSEEEYVRKVDLLMKHFATQRSKHWFTPETFLSLMRIRGLESRSPSGYAEAFYARKISV